MKRTAERAEEMALSKRICQKPGSNFNSENNDQDVLLQREIFHKLKHSKGLS